MTIRLEIEFFDRLKRPRTGPLFGGTAYGRGTNIRIIKPTFHFYPRGIKSLVGNSIRNNNGKYAIFIMKHRKKSYFDIMRRIIEKERERESLIMIWGHSWEIEKLHLWDELISFFQFVKSNYSDEICDYSEFTNML